MTNKKNKRINGWKKMNGKKNKYWGKIINN